MHALKVARRRGVVVALLVAVFAGGFIAGRSSETSTAHATTSLWADSCFYRSSTQYNEYGSYTLVTAAAWDVGYRGRTESVLDYSARQALASFDCERLY